MTDKELLELAAKAHCGLVQAKHNGDWIHEDADGNRGAWWNPLTDDGDALRLAVSLGMFDGGNRDYMNFRTLEIIAGLDPYAATRRAVVRAAAEIGRSLP